jgi:hypothetical protein
MIVLTEEEATKAIALCDKIKERCETVQRDLRAALIGLKQTCDKIAADCGQQKEAA